MERPPSAALRSTPSIESAPSAPLRRLEPLAGPVATTVPHYLAVIVERGSRRRCGGSLKTRSLTNDGRECPGANCSFIRRARVVRDGPHRGQVARGSLDRATGLLTGRGAEVPATASRRDLEKIVWERFRTLGAGKEKASRRLKRCSASSIRWWTWRPARVPLAARGTPR